MKKITFLLFTFLTVTLGYSQTTVWSDNFDDEDVSDWTLTDSDGDGNNWGDIFRIGNGAGGYVTPFSLISRSWQGVPLTPDNWAVSPAIDLSSASGVITLNWITQVAAASWDDEKYSVHVGTSNDISVLVNSATSMTQILGDAGNTGTPTAQTFDISAMAGEAVVYVAFRHWGVTDRDFISIDDVVLSAETLSVDEFASNNFKHFYNSNSDVLTLQSAQSPLSNVEIYNVIGQQVMNKSLSQSTETLNLSELQDGVYLAKVMIEGQVKTVKFLKQ